MAKKNIKSWIGPIHVSWRNKIGGKRYLIAKVKRNLDGHTFAYCKELDSAIAEGFDYFPSFNDVKKVYKENVIEVLSLRLLTQERPDRAEYLKFWEAVGVEDLYDLLALTQGKSPTDNFEFLAHYYPQKGMKFVTDLAGLSHSKLARGFVQVGDILTYRFEQNNRSDSLAVAVYKSDIRLGFIKRIHNRSFHSAKTRLKLTVKHIEENGTMKEIYVKVEV